MPEDALDRLYGKIRSKYEFCPEENANVAMRTQCMTSFRKWKESLKLLHFTSKKSLKEVENSCPKHVNKEQWRWLIYSYWNSADQRKRSESNRASALSKSIHSACGAKSIGRIIHEMENETCDGDPQYITLWTMTKKHGDGFEKDGEVVLGEFQKLHEKKVAEEGADNLTIDEAYVEVLGYCSGYARGLGKGHHVLHNKGNKQKAQMANEIQRLTERDYEMRNEIEMLKQELQRKEADAQRKEDEAREREQKREEEARAREEKLRADMNSKFQDIMNRLGIN